VHSARLDVGSREADEDEALGLNCAWFADILLTLTEGLSDSITKRGSGGTPGI